MNIKLFALSQSKKLAENISRELEIPLGKMRTEKFADGEISVSFKETIRGKKIYLVGSLNQPHDNFIELILALDAAKRAGASKVHLIIPYLGYSRQDRKTQNRGCIASRVIANMLSSAGMDSALTLDLHAGQIDGFYNFNSPLIHIQGKDIFIPYLKNIIKSNNTEYVVASCDVGGIARSKQFADILNLPLIVINKRRDKPNSIGSMELIGSNNVKDKHIIIIDDICDTANSLIKSCDLLLENQAKAVSACISHSVMSLNAYELISNSKLTKLYISDTIPVEDFKNGFPLPKQIEVISCAPAISRVIKAINSKKSVEQELQQFLEQQH